MLTLWFLQKNLKERGGEVKIKNPQEYKGMFVNNFEQEIRSTTKVPTGIKKKMFFKSSIRQKVIKYKYPRQNSVVCHSI